MSLRSFDSLSRCEERRKCIDREEISGKPLCSPKPETETLDQVETVGRNRGYRGNEGKRGHRLLDVSISSVSTFCQGEIEMEEMAEYIYPRFRIRNKLQYLKI